MYISDVFDIIPVHAVCISGLFNKVPSRGVCVSQVCLTLSRLTILTALSVGVRAALNKPQQTWSTVEVFFGPQPLTTQFLLLTGPTSCVHQHKTLTFI